MPDQEPTLRFVRTDVQGGGRAHPWRHKAASDSPLDGSTLTCGYLGAYICQNSSTWTLENGLLLHVSYIQ